MPIAKEMREALSRGELFIEYLPTVMLAEGRCVGAEALVRWRRGANVLSANAFIPLIENSPVSVTLTYWVLDRVAAELGRWLGEHGESHISVNVPPEILGRGGLAYAAARSGLHARVDQIVLEITERGAPDRFGLAALKLLAHCGVRLALDDTMLSSANLALLTRCNFSILKLDRLLVSQLKSGVARPDWLPQLESLLRTSALQVIAEGVETLEQAECLRDIGVQMAQGYFFSTPLRAQAFMDFWEHRQYAAAAQ